MPLDAGLVDHGYTASELWGLGYLAETKGPTRYLVIRNADRGFVYFSAQDGFIAPVPAEDRDGNPHDFSERARLEGAREVDLTGQGRYDAILGPLTWGSSTRRRPGRPPWSSFRSGSSVRRLAALVADRRLRQSREQFAERLQFLVAEAAFERLPDAP